MRFDYSDEDKGWDIEGEVSGRLVEFRPPTRHEPAEGGHLEDVEFKVDGFDLNINGKAFKIDLTPEMAEQLEIIIMDDYEKNDMFGQRIYSLFDER